MKTFRDITIQNLISNIGMTETQALSVCELITKILKDDGMPLMEWEADASYYSENFQRDLWKREILPIAYAWTVKNCPDASFKHILESHTIPIVDTLTTSTKNHLSKIFDKPKYVYYQIKPDVGHDNGIVINRCSSMEAAKVWREESFSGEYHKCHIIPIETEMVLPFCDTPIYLAGISRMPVLTINKELTLVQA